jgi:hypothetical protein
MVYAMEVSIPLIPYPEVSRELMILQDGKKLSDPYVLEIKLASKARRDIPSASFDQGKPLRLDVGVPIITLNKTWSFPESAVMPRVEIDGTALRIGPDLIHKRQTMIFSVLVDGVDARLNCQSPLIDVRLRRENQYQARLEGSKKAITWGAIIFLVFYLVTQPSNFGHAFQSFFDGLNNAANSLARFVRSLPF